MDVPRQPRRASCLTLRSPRGAGRVEHPSFDLRPRRGESDDGASSIIQTADGGYAVFGYTFSSGSGYSDIYLIKTDSSGNTTWERTYGAAKWDYGNVIMQTPDGGYIILSSIRSFGAGGFDVYLIKTDSNGNSLWART